MYDRKVFLNHGIRHVDLFYEDGGNPTDAILQAFLQVCEQERGAIAVHCKAGLGRTGTNIAAYMIKHYGYTTKEAIAWSRVCRPGCVVGPQQQYLTVIEQKLLREGEEYQLRNSIMQQQQQQRPTASQSSGVGVVNGENSQSSSTKENHGNNGRSGSTTLLKSGKVGGHRAGDNNSSNNVAHYQTIHTGLQQIIAAERDTSTPNGQPPLSRRKSLSKKGGPTDLTSGTDAAGADDSLSLPKLSRFDGMLSE